jgi:3-hydroxyisobutyrate dehydrogenase
MRVAVLGTGTMGAGMARTLAREGFDVVAWNRTRERAEPLTDVGIRVADSVGDAVTGADVVITMVFDVDAVLEICPEITNALGTDSVWLQSSTVGPQGTSRVAEAAAGTPLLDAPMVGTKEPAEQGKLVALVSGRHELIARAKPVLDAVATKTVEVGDELGGASALKLACNAWIASITAAAAQSVALASSLGVDPQLFLQAVDGGPANAPYLQLKGKAMLAEDWTPSFGVNGLAKDIDLMREAGAAAGSFDLALLNTLHELYAAAGQAGHGSDDIAAVRTAFS